MKEDMIHDALNLLDEDLIGEVEWLRSRKKKKNTKWISWTAAAACCLFVIGGLYTSLLGGMKSYDSAENSVENAAIEDMGSSIDNDLPIIAENEQNKDKFGQEEAREVPAFLVEIVKWEESGFDGTIVGIIDTDIYPVGTGVYVETGTNLKLADCNAVYPEGSVVHVQFNEREESDRIILYAEMIELVETE